MLCMSTRSTTRSFARADDTNIVRSRDAQYKTEESAESDSLHLHCASFLPIIVMNLSQSDFYWKDKEKSIYTVVFFSVLFVNHVKKFGSNFNQDNVLTVVKCVFSRVSVTKILQLFLEIRSFNKP